MGKSAIGVMMGLAFPPSGPDPAPFGPIDDPDGQQVTQLIPKR